jgi:hypothetical protein
VTPLNAAAGMREESASLARKKRGTKTKRKTTEAHRSAMASRRSNTMNLLDLMLKLGDADDALLSARIVEIHLIAP